MNAEDHFRAVAPLHMRQLLKDFPDLGDLDAAAIFGNAGHESKGLTDDQEDNPTVKGSRGGLNWMQWTGPRRRALEAFAKRNNFDPTGDKAAYLWLVKELKGEEKGAIPAIRAAKTLRDKVVAFEKAFLRAGVKHYDSRLKWAKIALEEISKPAARPAEPATKPSTGPGAFPEKGARNNEVVAQVQRRLRELGYHEVGAVDGDFGESTESGILVFRKDNGLPLSGAIDSSLLVALTKASPRPIAAAREEATPETVREKVGEARDSWWSKVVAFWGMAGTGVVTAVNFVITNLEEARKTVKPLTDVLGTVPLWAWGLLFGGGLLTIYLKSRASVAKSVAAYQEGVRR